MAIRTKGVYVEYDAGEAITNRRAVAIVDGLAVHCDNLNPDHKGLLRGLATNAAAIGQVVTIQRLGPYRWTGGIWIAKRDLWVGPDGVVTQSPPSTGWVRKLGVADEETLVDIALEPEAATSDKSYTHSQTIAATVWTINHNLGKRPSIEVADSAGTIVVGHVQHVDDNQAIVKFAGSFSGKAYCN